MKEYFTAFLLITIAEMGDKTQLLAMAFASKFKPISVLIGIGIGAFLNHGIAIVIGNYISKIIPINVIQIIASVLFLVFGFWSLKLDSEDEDENSVKSNYGPIITVAIAFFIGELGDKTQLTAMTLGANSAYPILVLLGTVTGMILTGGLGIIVGKLLGKKIPEVTMKFIAAFVFMIFGSIGLYTRLPNNFLTPINMICYIGIIILIISLILRKNALYKDKQYENKLADILLQCKNCGENHKYECPVNLARVNIEEEYLGENIPFVGNVIKYLESLQFKHSDFGKKVQNTYQNCK